MEKPITYRIEVKRWGANDEPNAKEAYHYSFSFSDFEIASARFDQWARESTDYALTIRSKTILSFYKDEVETFEMIIDTTKHK